MISDKVLTSLEIDKVLNKVKNYLSLQKSAEILFSEKPADNFIDMADKLANTREADILISSYNFDSVSTYDDIENILIKCQKQITLIISEILRVRGLLRSSRIFKTKTLEIKDESIVIFNKYALNLYIDVAFEKECDRCFISEEQVSDNASNQLYSIRKSIRKINEDIKKQLNIVLHSSANSKYVQDYYVTVRNGRYVIPVKAEFKNSIKGMLHDHSDSGATVYIEPESVVRLNNDLKILEIKEAEEIERILQTFTSQVNIIAESLRINDDILIKADIAFAKAKYAHRTNSVFPILNRDGYINIINGRHPLIDKDVIVPVSVSFGREHKYLIVTGPNTGGKTVTLKLCGLFTAMALCGLYLPASDESEISFFENIFTDIGDEQSIEHNLSTFSSHMTNIIDICNKVNQKSLVLIDEIGAGTDPAEGSALALSIVQHLLNSGSKGIITTHYNELKEFAFINKGAVNASMEFDPVALTPTYKLKFGLPGSSNALEISKKLGLNEDIISNAYKNLKSEKIQFEKVLKSAEEARINAEKNLEESERIKAEYQQMLTEIKKREEDLKHLNDNLTSKAKAEAKRIYADAALESEELIKQLKDIISSEHITEYDLNRTRQIKKQLNDKKYQYESALIDESLNELKPLKKATIGQSVYIKSLNNSGIITDISKSSITLKTGNLIINTKTDDLFYASEKIKTAEAPQISIVKNIVPKETVTEIKVLGKTILEALPEIDNFLDGCSISGINECKIIHGVGTGVLKKAVWEHLKKHPLVDNYRSGKYGEGEKGVTIVNLK